MLARKAILVNKALRAIPELKAYKVFRDQKVTLVHKVFKVLKETLESKVQQDQVLILAWPLHFQ